MLNAISYGRVAIALLLGFLLTAFTPGHPPINGLPAASDATKSGVESSIPQQSLYPGLEGAELRAAIRADFGPDQTLGYGPARDVLFQYLDDTRGELRGVYTGYAITLTPGEDPTKDAFERGINTEHTWPQSKGAGDEPAKSDMHALYPTKDNVNSSRSNHPYAEIPDDETDGWYRLDQSQSNIPTSNIDEYSEKDNEHPAAGYDGRFEPREDHKGNAARAALYFYVIYETFAETADPDFIDVQKEAIRAWHEADHVDQLEYDRSEFIKGHQGTANPFVLDMTLVRRALKDLPEDGGGGDAETGTLVISEIMPDPDDVPDEDGEWFEVYNPGDSDVNMDGWSIHDDDNDDAFISGTVIVPAGGFAVLCKNNDESVNGGVACDYDYVSDSNPNNFFIANGDDELILRDGEGTEVDRVEYDRDADWPDEKGASMVYLDDPEADNNTPLAWGEASAREGRYDDPGSDLGSPGVNGTGQVLPVELIAFDARQTGETIQLTWRTASETNNAGFGVERSVGSGAFEEVAFVHGAGTTSEPQRYRHTDENVRYAAKRIRYRLRQVDYDGTVAYSSEVEIVPEAPEALTLRAPFPNPTSGRTTVRYELAQSGPVRLEAYDALGRRVATLVDGWHEAGRMEMMFNTSSLSSGVYIIRLSAGGAAALQKVTVLR